MTNRANFIVNIQANMFLISLLFIFGIFAIILIPIGALSIDKAKNNTYKKTQAEVTQVLNEDKKTINGKCKGSYCKPDTFQFHTNVVFKYYVDGEEYSGTTTLIDDNNFKSEGHFFQIEYNPNNPSVYRSKSMGIIGSVLMLIFGIVFLILAISVIVCMRSKSCREYAAMTSMMSGGGMAFPNFSNFGNIDNLGFNFN